MQGWKVESWDRLSNKVTREGLSGDCFSQRPKRWGGARCLSVRVTEMSLFKMETIIVPSEIKHVKKTLSTVPGM